MKNRDANEDAILTPKSEREFLSFVSITDVPMVSKRMRDLVLYYQRTNKDQSIDWAEFLLHLHSLFQFLDAIEQEYF